MKYIVCRVYKSGKVFLDIPFIFPDIMVHSVVYEGARMSLHLQYPRDQGYRVKPLSAGFMSSMDLTAACHGESTTLKMKSRGKVDTNLMVMADYGSCAMTIGKPAPIPRKRCRITDTRGNCKCGFGQCAKGNIL